MASVRLLYDLQGLDLEVDKLTERLAQVRRRLGDERPLESLRRSVQEAREQLQRLRAQHRDAEMTSRAARDKAQTLEQKMYGGSVRNPRELTGMQEEMAYLRKHQQEAEDALLNAMIALEECREDVAGEEEKLRQAEAVWRQEQQSLQEESAALERELGRLQEGRRALLARVQAPDVQTYEQLRKAHGGRAVARVDRGMCEVCRITLSTKELQQAQTSPGTARCGSCGRLLLVR